MPADEESSKKAGEILCCMYIVANGEHDKTIYDTDVIKEVNKAYNTNYERNLPDNALQYLEDSGFIVRWPGGTKGQHCSYRIWYGNC